MDFGSVNFLLIFLPVFTIIYWIIPGKERSRLIFLGSILFCGINSPVSLIPLSVSIIGNFALSKVLSEKSLLIDKNEKLKKRIYLGLGILLNVVILAVFKAGIFNLDAIKNLGINTEIFRDLMPIGISFYTFTAIAYLIDIYKEEQKGLRLWDFGAFLSMFPKLSMGPISNAKIMENHEDKRVDAYAVQDGIKLLIIGLGLKILLADRLNMLWHELEVTGYDCISKEMAWLGVMVFSLKLYFDFYGYSLMAIGAGRMLGFDLPDNFNTPYMCRSVRDFYRCWHMTLGKWFARYVYIPLGGSKKGEARTIINLFVVWLLTALWHGFTLNYLMWGGLLFICIVIERQIANYVAPLIPEQGWGNTLLMKIVPHCYLLVVIGISWILFAITDPELLLAYLSRMFEIVPGSLVQQGGLVSAVCRYWKELGIGLLCATPIMKKLYDKIKDTYEGWIVVGVIFWICIWRIVAEGSNPFMYGAF